MPVFLNGQRIQNLIRERLLLFRVSSRRNGNDLLIVWEDNGVGIPPGNKETIFERGFGGGIRDLGCFLPG